MKVLGAIGLLLMTFSLCFSQDVKPVEDGGSGILYGEDHAYSVTAPKGWVLDNRAGASQGVHAVFYPLGKSWADAPAVMYTNVWRKDKENSTIEEVIENDIRSFRERSASLKVNEAPDISIKGGKKALVRLFTGDVHGNYEAIAYIDEPKLVVLFVLSSKTKEDFETSLGLFDELVKSYFFITDDVELVTKKESDERQD